MTALVLLPGLEGTGTLFKDFISELGDELDIIVIPYPKDESLSYSDLGALVRQNLPVDKQFFLLAESFSGPIGISIAALLPKGLLGLILCCSFARNPLPALAPVKQLASAVPISFIPHFVLNFLLLGRYSTSQLRSALAHAVELVSTEVLQRRAFEALAVDVSEELALVEVPILYLLATEDRVVTRTSFEHIRNRHPDIRLEEFIAPHFLLQVLPGEIANAVRNFMNSITENAP